MVRIVRMTFQSDKVNDFRKLFNDTYDRIRNFEGCRFLELYQDQSDDSVFYTISKWEHERHLEDYRKSDLFRTTWAITRSMFSAPPLAYSLCNEVADSTNPF